MKNKHEEYLKVWDELRIAELYAKRFPSTYNISEVIRLRKYALIVYKSLPRKHQADPALKPGQGIGNGPLLTPPGKVGYKPPSKVERRLRNSASNWVMSFRGRDN